MRFWSLTCYSQHSSATQVRNAWGIKCFYLSSSQCWRAFLIPWYSRAAWQIHLSIHQKWDNLKSFVRVWTLQFIYWVILLWWMWDLFQLFLWEMVAAGFTPNACLEIFCAGAESQMWIILCVNYFPEENISSSCSCTLEWWRKISFSSQKKISLADSEDFAGANLKCTTLRWQQRVF